MAEILNPGLRILMVDDSPDDVFLVRRALQASGIEGWLQSAADGEEGIGYLRGQGEFGDRARHPFPNVLLLDLKMPRVDGFGVLRWLKGHPDCKVIPVIVFSSSFLESDVREAYTLGANAFISKPAGLNELIEILRAALGFWSRCEVPRPPEGERCG